MKIGIAQVDYTPQTGLPLQGNYRKDDYAARGTHDPLKARAIVLQNSQNTKIALLTIDICMLDIENANHIRKFIADNTNITYDNILVAATHTHAGPGVGGSTGDRPVVDLETSQPFLEKAATAVIDANKNLAETQLAVGSTFEDRVSFNRRLRCKDGSTHMNWEGLDPDFVAEPWGPIDPQLQTLTFTQNGQRKAALVNFGLHPAILAGDNWLYSADFIGYLDEALARLHGDQDFITTFFNGPCGNVNHIDYADPLQGRGYQMTQRVGHILAVDAFEAIANETPVNGDQLEFARKTVALTRVQIPQDDVDKAKKIIEDAKDQPEDGLVDGLPDSYYAKVALELHELQNEDHLVEILAIRIGDLAIVGIPGELFCEFGMQIKQASPAKSTLVFELVEGAIAYLPTKESFPQGGYEPTTGSTRYQPGAGEKLTQTAIDLLNNLF